MYRLLSVNIGKPKTHIINNKSLHTGFIKHKVEGSVYLTKTGIIGDGQADLKNHGGEDKALLMYPIDHYYYWEKKYGRAFDIPAFGENITIDGLTEKDVHIGDIYRLGETVIQVSQPRNPCYKIAEVHQIKDIPAIVTDTGFSGYYFRVLQEGQFSSDDSLILIEKDPHEIRVSDVQQLLFHNKDDIKQINNVLAVEPLASSIKQTLIKRLNKLV